jgi:hypothetical protein
MSTQKIIAVLLLVMGVLTLTYGGFNYVRQSHQANIGSLHVSVDEQRHVNLPVWMGVGALVLGGILLLPRKA